MICCSGAEGMGRFWDLKGCCLLSPAGSQPRGGSGEENHFELLENLRAHFQTAVSGTLTGLPVLEWEADSEWCHWAGLHGAEVGVGDDKEDNKALSPASGIDSRHHMLHWGLARR